jgi:hypothetical protein
MMKKTMMSDYNLDKRRYVIGGVAIAIVVVYIIRLFTLQLLSFVCVPLRNPFPFKPPDPMAISL